MRASGYYSLFITICYIHSENLRHYSHYKWVCHCLEGNNDSWGGLRGSRRWYKSSLPGLMYKLTSKMVCKILVYVYSRKSLIRTSVIQIWNSKIMVFIEVLLCIKWKVLYFVYKLYYFTYPNNSYLNTPWSQHVWISDFPLYSAF